MSLDEAYLDVTDDRRRLGTATAIAQEIRARIRADTGLTASAGVSYNKFIAKLASDHNKPDGLCVITPRQGPAFVQRQPVKRFHGVGPVTQRKMEALGILTGAEPRRLGRWPSLSATSAQAPATTIVPPMGLITVRFARIGCASRSAPSEPSRST